MVMFGLIFLISLISAPDHAQKSPPQGNSDTICITGSCWDIATGVDLKVKATAINNGKRWVIGESNDNGIFDLPVPISSTELIFEAPGYRTVSEPLNIQGKPTRNDKFQLTLNMIALDSQQITRPYQTAQLSNPQTNEDESRKTHFEVRDAYTGKVLTAKICLTFTRSGRSYCLDTDSSRAPLASFVGELDNLDLNVTSSGFQAYSGSLKINKNISGELVYQIKLLRNKNNLSFALDAHDRTDVKLLSGANNRFGTETPLKKGSSMFHLFAYNVTPVEIQTIIFSGSGASAKGDVSLADYITQLKSAGNTIFAQGTFTARNGINLFALHGAAPDSNPIPLVTNDTANMNVGIRTLYFDQSSYALRSASKVTLDSISQFLLRQKNSTAQITGHTDNVGKRFLNVSLSEYRARVVANYLRQKGVQAQQVSFKWKGPDSPVAANDTEQNKVKNRRVEIITSELTK